MPGLVVVALLAQPAALPQAPVIRLFDRVLLLETTSETSAGVSLGDIYGDGHLDIVLAKERHWPLNNLVLRSDGKGHFTTAVLGDAPDRTYSAALADLDGDGHLDIVVSNDRPDRKLIYLNDGKGRFRVAGTFGQPEWSTRYVTVADLNGDKRPDLVVANRSSNPATPRPSFVCLNDGTGGFPSCTSLATQSATIIVAADLDGDRFVDLFVPHRDGGQNLIFWNDGAGGFAAAPSTVGPEHNSIRAAAAADINGDGIPDLIVGDERTGMFLCVGAGHRTFEAPAALGVGSGAPYAIPWPISIAMAGRTSWWADKRRAARSSSTWAATRCPASAKRPGTMARAPCTAWRLATLMATDGQTSPRPDQTPPTRSGSTGPRSGSSRRSFRMLLRTPGTVPVERACSDRSGRRGRLR
jgi:hypothetical protein